MYPPPLLPRKAGDDSLSDDELPPSMFLRRPVVPPSGRAPVVATVMMDSDPSSAEFQRAFRQMQLSSVHLESASDLEEVD